MREPRLLIRLGSLGDVVLATAAANAGRARWGERSLDVVVKEEWATLWQGHPAVRRVWSWPRKERGPAGILRLARRLAREHYTEVIDLQGSVRTRALCAAAGLRSVRRPRRRDVRRRLLVGLHRWGPPGGFRMGQSFAEAVGGVSGAEPSLHPGEKARQRAGSLLEGGSAPVGLIPGARHATKRWPLERFVEVGRRMAARHRAPVPVFFGPDEDALLASWGRQWGKEPGWIAVQADLMTVAACFERLAVVVTNDTGLMHVAEGVGTAVVALFGPTVQSLGFAPWRPASRVVEVEELACRPCSLHGSSRCQRRDFRCLLEIDAGRVVQIVEDVLSAVGTPEPAIVS